MTLILIQTKGTIRTGTQNLQSGANRGGSTAHQAMLWWSWLLHIMGRIILWSYHIFQLYFYCCDKCFVSYIWYHLISYHTMTILSLNHIILTTYRPLPMPTSTRCSCTTSTLRANGQARRLSHAKIWAIFWPTAERLTPWWDGMMRLWEDSRIGLSKMTDVARVVLHRGAPAWASTSMTASFICRSMTGIANLAVNEYVLICSKIEAVYSSRWCKNTKDVSWTFFC